MPDNDYCPVCDDHADWEEDEDGNEVCCECGGAPVNTDPDLEER